LEARYRKYQRNRRKLKFNLYIMKTQREVFNKLFKEDKVELSDERVELALVDDAKKIRGEYASIDEDSYFSFVVKAEVEGEKVINDYKQILKKVESITPKLESAINELGINRNNFQVLDDLDSVKSQLKERISIVSKNINKLKSINP